MISPAIGIVFVVIMIMKRFRKDMIAMNRLTSAAEIARINMTSYEEVPIFVSGGVIDNVAVDCEEIINRKIFEKLSSGLLGRILRQLREVAIMAGVNLPGESGTLGVNNDSYDLTSYRNSFRGDNDNDDDDDIVVDALNEDSNTAVEMNEIAVDNKDMHVAVIDSETTATTTASVSTTKYSQQYDENTVERLKKNQSKNKQARKERSIQKHNFNALGINKRSVGQELASLRMKCKDNSVLYFPGGQTIHEVILVGGASKMPLIHRFLKVITGGQLPLRNVVHPEEAVSLGAAVMAGVLDGQIHDMKIVSSWQASLIRLMYEESMRGRKNATCNG